MCGPPSALSRISIAVSSGDTLSGFKMQAFSLSLFETVSSVEYVSKGVLLHDSTMSVLHSSYSGTILICNNKTAVNVAAEDFLINYVNSPLQALL